MFITIYIAKKRSNLKLLSFNNWQETQSILTKILNFYIIPFLLCLN